MTDVHTEGHSAAFTKFISARPPLAQAVAEMGRVIWEDPPVDPAIKERARIAASRAIGSAFCTAFRTTGLDGPLIGEVVEASDDERTVVAEESAAQIVANTGTLDASLLEELHARFTDEEVTDLVFSIAYFVGNTLVMKALQLE